MDFGRKTGRAAAQRVCLGATGPILAEGHAKNRQTSPASFFSSPLPFGLGAYCHLQGPPKSVDFGRKTGRAAAQRVCLGATGPILAEGHAKTGKRRPPRALACGPAPFVAANSTYSLRLRLSLSEGRPALTAAHRVCLGGHRPHFGERARQNRQTSPASFFSSPLPFWLGVYCHLQGPPKSVDFGRKTGRAAAQRVCLGATGPILAEGHAKNRQTSPASCFSSRAYRFR